MKVNRLILPFILCILLIEGNDAARILAIVPTPSFSHQVFFRPLWKDLAKRGHEVTLLTTDPIKDPTLRTLREIDLSESYKSWNASVMELVTKNDDKFAMMQFMLDILYEVTEIQLKHAEVQSLYHNKTEQFDLIMIEYLLPTMMVFKHKFNVPVIALTSLDGTYIAHEVVGNPTHMILYPDSMLPFAKELSFVNRLTAMAFYTFFMVSSHLSIMPRINQIIKDNLDKDIPDVQLVSREIDMIFVNANPLFTVIRPFTPAAISIAGGLHEAEKKPLPKELKDYLDGARGGVIYFSLGSNVKSKDIAPETRNIIIETFKDLPYKILWKFEADTLDDKPDNVKIMKWLPQQDILRHKNIKLFITQAGLQSLEEALYARVPLIVLPFFADQEANAHRVQANGLGLYLDHKSLTVQEFRTAINEVITNKEYRKKVKEMADMIQDQPMKPLEKAVWWTEYVIRHKGAKHLHGPKLPFYQIYYLDITAFIAGSLILLLSVVGLICKKVFDLICSMRQKSKLHKQKTK